ncbi:SRPBCC family protein [Micromonospora sp. NPDC049679]|uniref:SRPBCC family protein n=1 Tax=Micromonospora sp. NPDC049679 TaxID=3155920 RepID=UPI0033E51280
MTGTFDPVSDTDRELRSHHTGLNTLLIRRSYDATAEDVWDALTDPERLVRWFLPITGDLRVGGRYSLEGNASGEIVRCDKPREIAVTWEFGGGTSDVRLLLTPKGDTTVLELEHSPVPAEIIPNASPEMWGLGAGWEMGLTALGDYLAGKLPEGRAADWIASASPEDLMAAGQLSVRISDAWSAVIAARQTP